MPSGGWLFSGPSVKFNPKAQMQTFLNKKYGKKRGK